MQPLQHSCLALLLAAAHLLAAPARADVVTDWNAVASDVAAAAKLSPPAAYRALALVQTAVFEAVDAPARRHPGHRVELAAPEGASIDAAVAAANRAVLSNVAPSQAEAIRYAFDAALAGIPDGRAKQDGLALGERAAELVLALRADDGADASQAYRPATTPGTYVATSLPAVPQWPARRPWHLARADQFRPEPPPALSGEVFARDFREIRALGSKSSATRTPEQTEIARFWEATMPSIYFSVVRSVARTPGRDLARNARLYAAAAQAMDDALIAVFDAKYRFGFWRPITAIRNADQDGNEATERDAGWLPFVETPMHPEYPAAHCGLAGALGAVLQAELGAEPRPLLSASSPTAPGTTRSWKRVEDFVREVEDARVFDGVHFRNSTAVGSELGRRVGELAAARTFGAAH